MKPLHDLNGMTEDQQLVLRHVFNFDFYTNVIARPDGSIQYDYRGRTNTFEAYEVRAEARYIRGNNTNNEEEGEEPNPCEMRGHEFANDGYCNNCEIYDEWFDDNVQREVDEPVTGQ